MSQTLKNTLNVFGMNKRDWQPHLFNEISKEQLTTDFGGTKEFPITPYELRTLQEYPC
jgi:hypothetical protein